LKKTQFMLSNASKYAIRSILFLADKSSKDKKFGAKEIAHELEIPLSFVAKILQKMAKAGVISSSKGPGGGFYTSPENLNNNILKILSLTEQTDIFEGCFLGLPRCSDENPCPIHHIVAPFKETLYTKFQNQSLRDFAIEIKQNGSYLSLKGIDVKTDNLFK